MADSIERDMFLLESEESQLLVLQSEKPRSWLPWFPLHARQRLLASSGILAIVVFVAACCGLRQGHRLASSNSLGDEVVLVGEPCKWTLYRGMRIPGFSISAHKTQSLEGCMRLCKDVKRCKAVEYATTRQDKDNVFQPGHCILQSTAEGREDCSETPGYRNIDLYIEDSCGEHTQAAASSSRAATTPSSRGNHSRRGAERSASAATTSSTTTTPPCIPKAVTAGPSIFGFAVMTPGPEVALLQSQFAKKAGIFGCNDYAVISVENTSLGKDECWNDVYSWFNADLRSVPKGNLGEAGITTNTGTFINAWDMLMNSGKLWKHEWVMKADPDAVMLSDRVRGHVAQYTGAPHYVLNCNYRGQMRLFGAIEVFSVPAIAAYHSKPWVCKNMDWRGWGEDTYMANCMNALGVPSVVDLNLVGDSRCWGRPCEDGGVAAFHPYKDMGQWWGCWGRATATR